MPTLPVPLYRYGYGQSVVHILPPPVAGETPGCFSLHSALCGTKRSLYRPAGLYADLARSAQVCKRCQTVWRQATGTPAPTPTPSQPKAPVTRDVQRQRLYQSEGYIAPGRTFRSEAEALAYAKALLASDWAQRHFGTVRLSRVRFTTGLGAYSYNGRQMITLGYSQRHERTLLHEIAHQIVYQGFARAIQAHGPLFARVVHALVQHKLGVGPAQALLEGYRAKKVRVASPALLDRYAGRPRPANWKTAIHEGRVPA